ncbi:MAG: DinB family protein [Sumerlaeia bacterium]
MSDPHAISPMAAAYIKSLETSLMMLRRLQTEPWQPGHLAFTPPHSTTSIHWSLGHIVGSTNRILIGLTGHGKLSDGQLKLFGRGTGHDAAAAYPAPDILMHQLEEIGEAAKAAIAAHSDEALIDEPPAGPVPEFMKTKNDVVNFMILHNVYHVGQVALLRRMQGLPNLIG